MITSMPRIAIAADDFGGLVDTFRRKLGMPVIDLSDRTLPSLGARIAMCVAPGGSNIELMSPGVESAPLSQSLRRFLARRGAGLFALMLEAPDPNAQAEVLKARGLNVLALMEGAGGRDVHPNSTHGVLIRVYPVNSFDEAPPPGTPTGTLSGVARVIIAVRDLDDAHAAYGQRLGLAADAPSEDAERGVAFSIVRPPAGGTIELVSVRDRTRPFARAIAEHLDANPEGLYALVLRAADPAGTLGALRANGLDARIAPDAPRVVEIARASAFGALLRIEPDA